jgi:hypothetical protein
MDLLWLDRSFSSVCHGPREKDLDKRLRSLTILTAKMEILACKAALFHSTHPLPKVRILQPKIFCPSIASLCYMLLIFCLVNPFAGSPIFDFASSSS